MRQGFSRIELVVALVMIAGIAAMILSAVSSMGSNRAARQQNMCLSAVKQIQLGLIAYAADYNQTYPAERRGTGGTALNWPSAILGYAVCNVQVFLCPSDAVPTGSVILPQPSAVPGCSYGLNSYVGTGKLTDREIKYPAEMLGVMDAVSYSIPYGATLAEVRNCVTTDGTKGTARHNEGCNQSYMDGHVKWIAFENLPDPAGGKPAAKSKAKHYWQGTD